MTTRSTALVAALFTALACASETQDDTPEDDTSTAGTSRGGGASNNGHLPTAGTTVTTPTTAGTTAAGGTNSGGNTSNHAGNANGGKPSGTSGGANGGTAGKNAGGSSNAGTGGTGGTSGGTLNQPTQCDEATATVLGSMSSNVTVASNACLKMTLPADQTWIKKITLQPDGGTFPLAFTWSNCGTNSNGAFTANYANAILTPVTPTCPIFVKLTGPGTPLNIQWWGG